VDDAKIAALTAEVLAELRAPAVPGGSRAVPDPGLGALEARVAALEAAVRILAGAPAAPSSPTPPSRWLLGPSGGPSGACVLEPDQPCVGSGQCRTFGH
jgi:hypothetical protein